MSPKPRSALHKKRVAEDNIDEKKAPPKRAKSISKFKLLISIIHLMSLEFKGARKSDLMCTCELFCSIAGSAPSTAARVVPSRPRRAMEPMEVAEDNIDEKKPPPKRAKSISKL